MAEKPPKRLRWCDLEEAEKDRISKLYRQGDLRPAFTREADRLSCTVETLGRYVRQHLRPHTPPYQRKRAAQVNETRIPTHKKTDDTDTARWSDFLQSKARDVVKVMHLCDIHVPFQDVQAVALAVEMVRRFQPHVVVVGSDFADFYGISRFDSDPDVEGPDDEMSSFEEHWNPHIHDLKRAAPGAHLVYITGNHDRRALETMKKNAPKMRKRIERDFVDIVKCGGSVYWLGWRDEVLIGHSTSIRPLQVQHGIRHNEHVAKSALQDAALQMHVWQGHVHKRNYYSQTGPFYTVQAISSGCLCQIPAHYKRQGQTAQLGRGQEHGTALATYDMASGEVHFDNLLFTRDAQGVMSTLWAGQRVTA